MKRRLACLIKRRTKRINGAVQASYTQGYRDGFADATKFCETLRNTITGKD